MCYNEFSLRNRVRHMGRNVMRKYIIFLQMETVFVYHFIIEISTMCFKLFGWLQRITFYYQIVTDIKSQICDVIVKFYVATIIVKFSTHKCSQMHYNSQMHHNSQMLSVNTFFILHASILFRIIFSILAAVFSLIVSTAGPFAASVAKSDKFFIQKFQILTRKFWIVAFNLNNNRYSVTNNKQNTIQNILVWIPSFWIKNPPHLAILLAVYAHFKKIWFACVRTKLSKISVKKS